MSIKTASTPAMPGAPRGFGHRPNATIVGGTVLVAGLVLAGTWTYSRGDSPAATVQAPVVAVPPAAGLSPGRPLNTTRESRTIYLVSSDDMAATIDRGINEANAIRNSIGEAPLLDSVLVVPSAERATEVMNAIAEGNLILAGLGLDPDVVIDLRGS